MANRKCIESSSSWLSKSTTSLDVQFHVRGVPFTLNRDLLVGRSAKLAALFKQNPHEDLSSILRDIPADPETFELVARFCHGYELDISTENVIPLTCVAYYLGMNENHSPNNLLNEAVSFIDQRVIPSWNESIKALKSSENILQQAVNLGIVDACVDSIITKALSNPQLLGEPIKNFTSDDDSEENGNGNEFRPNAKKRLFFLDWKWEDLTTLSLKLYEPIIHAIVDHQVPLEYVSASLCLYVKKWVFFSTAGEENLSIHKRNSQREVIEAVERLLPHERELIPCTLLFEMLKFSNFLEASSECKNGFEIRIGNQLDMATVKDLLIPSQGYAKELQYDIECVRRIMKNFYCNYTRSDISGLVTVAELIEEFLQEIASDIDLEKTTFISLAEMSVSASVGTHRSSDGIYRAIDTFLEKRKYLTESEREEVCEVLDCPKLSPEACEHAAQNERLPLRVVVQVLFVGQLKLRETITKEVHGSDDRLRLLEDEGREEGEEAVQREMEKMGSKVSELERECLEMRREIESGCCIRGKREKVSVWKEMKRKFGCISSRNDCNCHVKRKKVHPR